MFPLKIPAIKVEQNLGEFYVTSIPASILLQICYTVETRILENKKQKTILGRALDAITGTQRKAKESRIEEIRKYSETVDASFPNSIILGANYDEEGKLIDVFDKKWFVEKINGNCYYLTIPTEEKLASIIDGQHRVFGFKNSKEIETPLVCSIFLDLPIPYHAQIFTTINMNQKRVDRNLAYNLFQFDMDEGDSEYWTPETLAVYYARVLANDDDSPLKGKLRLGLSDTETKTSISMASVIDGILSLITTNPKKDRVEMHNLEKDEGRSRTLLKEITSNAPLRSWFIEYQDKTLFELILDYVKAVDEIFWSKDIEIFNKTLGIQALFDILKEITLLKGTSHSYSKNEFSSILCSANYIDFSNVYFGVQTKVRARIKNSILITSGIKKLDDLHVSEEEKQLLISLLKLE